jgi:hypothetical protein
MKNAVYVYLNPADAESSAAWLHMFRNYLTYAIEEQRRMILTFIDLNKLTELAESDSDAVIIYFPVLTQPNLDNPEWLEQTREAIDILKIGAKGRYVFKINPEPIDMTSQPEWLKVYNRFDFAFKDSSGKLLKSSDYSSEEFLKLFIFKIFDISGDIVKAVLNKGNDEITEFDLTRSVYLAETTPDLGYTRHVVKRELVRHGYKVYPDKKYPVNYRDLNVQIDQDLRSCGLAIHLIGTTYPKPIPGKDISVAELQNTKAADYFTEFVDGGLGDFQLKRIIWLTEDMKAITERQKKWLTDIFKNERLQAGADIVKCPLEELKDIIFDKLDLIKEGDREVVETVKMKEIRLADKIYLIHNEEYADDAQRLKALLGEHSSCEILTVNQEDNQQEIIDAHKKYLIECSAVIFLSGANNLKWLRSKVSDMIKMKEYRKVKDYKFQAVISSRFNKLPEEPVFSNMMLINSEFELNEEMLLPVLERLN